MAGVVLQLLVTTYEILLSDLKYLCPIHWEVIIVDEGHRLRGVSKLKIALQV